MSVQEFEPIAIDSRFLLTKSADLPPQVFQQLIDEYVVVYGVLMRAMVSLGERLTKADRMSLCSGIEQELEDFVSARREGLFLYIWVREPRRFVFAVSPLIPRLELCDIEGLPTFH